MGSLEGLLREVHALDATAGRSSRLARIDPRAMVLVTLAFILTVVSFHRYTVAALLPLAIFPVVLAHLGEIDLAGIGRKLLPALPFALMIGLFNPWFDPAPQLVVFGQPVAGGWLSLTSILIRAVLTVAAALILIALLGMPRLCIALERLGVPPVLPRQLLFMHRYLLLLAGELRRMNLARELRSGQALSLAVYGTLLGHLLLRALERAQRIHQAMCARGFDGHLPAGRPLAWRGHDTAFLAGSLAVLALMRSTDLPALLGHWLIRIAA